VGVKRKNATRSAPAARRAPAAKTARRASAPVAAPSLELIVRRGALKRFAALTEKTADLPVKVSWDSRTDDRRRGADAGADGAEERRRSDRRQEPPFTWDSADFLVLERERVPSPPKRKPKKT
jgi:hypothetical protein